MQESCIQNLIIHWFIFGSLLNMNMKKKSNTKSWMNLLNKINIVINFKIFSISWQIKNYDFCFSNTNIEQDYMQVIRNNSSPVIGTV